MSRLPPDKAQAPAGLGALKISSRQITLLNALGEFGNLRRAAAAMHTTQPAASLLLQQLEERLGYVCSSACPGDASDAVWRGDDSLCAKRIA